MRRSKKKRITVSLPILPPSSLKVIEGGPSCYHTAQNAIALRTARIIQSQALGKYAHHGAMESWALGAVQAIPVPVHRLIPQLPAQSLRPSAARTPP